MRPERPGRAMAVDAGRAHWQRRAKRAAASAAAPCPASAERALIKKSRVASWQWSMHDDINIILAEPQASDAERTATDTSELHYKASRCRPSANTQTSGNARKMNMPLAAIKSAINRPPGLKISTPWGQENNENATVRLRKDQPKRANVQVSVRMNIIILLQQRCGHYVTGMIAVRLPRKITTMNNTMLANPRPSSCAQLKKEALTVHHIVSMHHTGIVHSAISRTNKCKKKDQETQKCSQKKHTHGACKTNYISVNASSGSNGGEVRRGVCWWRLGGYPPPLPPPVR